MTTVILLIHVMICLALVGVVRCERDADCRNALS